MTGVNDQRLPIIAGFVGEGTDSLADDNRSFKSDRIDDSRHTGLMRNRHKDQQPPKGWLPLPECLRD
ncbi:MAG: hypothetical protein JWP89_866 [Schlesneria sp.]|nr:hypothetical protein [Schlesneria sp.]